MAPNRIVEMVDQGVLPKQVAEKIPWDTLTVEEREQVFTEAESRILEPNANQLLEAMYHLTLEQPWDLLRVLTLYVRCKSSPYGRKVSALGIMRKKLDQLRDSFIGEVGRDTAQIKRYKHAEADYYALYGIVQCEENKIDDALRNLIAAQSRYDELGAQDRSAIIREKIAALREALEKNNTLMPVQALLDEREALKNEISQFTQKRDVLRDEVNRLQNEIELAAARLNQLETSSQEINLRVKQAEQEEARLAACCSAIQARIKDLHHQADTAEAGLRFLLSLQRAASAPLWVEVVRLALQQGEWDELTVRALERLYLSYPEEAGPLLAEIVARSADASIDESIYSALDGFALIAKASLEPDTNLEFKARCLLDGWNQILKVEERMRHV